MSGYIAGESADSPTGPPPTTMTKAERTTLVRLVRQRARIAKASIEGRQADILAALEAELATEYAFDDEAWAQVTAEAKQAIEVADGAIARRCAELGIRPEFRPRLHLGWHQRGGNAVAERRAELRKLAAAKLAALAAKARVAVDMDALERETALVAGALTSAEAKAFLEAMPTIEALMPPLAVAELEGGTR